MWFSLPDMMIAEIMLALEPDGAEIVRKTSLAEFGLSQPA
jgi:hypothetical protein